MKERLLTSLLTLYTFMMLGCQYDLTAVPVSPNVLPLIKPFPLDIYTIKDSKQKNGETPRLRVRRELKLTKNSCIMTVERVAGSLNLDYSRVEVVEEGKNCYQFQIIFR